MLGTRRFLPAIALAALLTFSVACTRINPGHVGVVVQNAGDDKGVLNAPVVTGWQFYMPGKTNIFQFPTYVQTAVWTKDVTEGKPQNEEMQFTSKDGQPISADVSFSYQLDPSKVPAFYVKFRIPGDNMDMFTHGQLRIIVREAMSNESPNFTAEDLYFGSKRVEFIRAVELRLKPFLDSYGVNVVQLGFVNNIRPPSNYVTAITDRNSKLMEVQKVQAQNQITQAEAIQRVIEAKGYADAKVAQAQGDAEAARLRNVSLTPQILESKRLEIQDKLAEKWDGKLPETMVPGAAVPFIDVQRPRQ